MRVLKYPRAAAANEKARSSARQDERVAFKAAAIEHVAAQPQAFEVAAGEIEAILRKHDPLQMLALAATYGLQGFVSDDGVMARGPFAKKDFSQHHVELCQALALRLPHEDSAQDLFGGQALERVDELSRMAHAFSMQRLVALQTQKSPEEHLLMQMQESLRLHTQFVRNWGRFTQIVDLSECLYAGMNAVFTQALGVSATDLISLVHSCTKRLEERQSARIEMLGKALNPRFSPDEMITRYFSQSPQFLLSMEDFLKDFPEHPSRENAAALIFNHADLLLQDFYRLTVDEAAKIIGRPAAALEKALDLLSLKQGEIAERKLDHLLLDNPVWTRPLIRFGGGAYFFPLPQAFFSHMHRIFAHLSAEIGASKALEERRSTFLEAEIERLARLGLPHARVEPNVKWSLGPDRYETDIVAVIDRAMIIIEAKSGAISDPALRGAPDRARRHVRELVIAPSIQSERFQKFVEAAQQGDETARTTLKTRHLWPLEIERFVRLSITLEDFSMVASAEQELKNVGWVENDRALAVNMTAADFEVACDILTEEAVLIHYLSERGRLQKRFDIFADELDWLGFYLETGFAFAAAEKSDLEGFMLSGLSKPIDDYVNARDLGVKAKKPAPRRTTLWRGVLAKIGERRMPGWIEATIALLRAASVDEQKEVQKHLRKLLRQPPRAWNKPDRKTAIFITPAYADAIPIILFAHPGCSLAEQRTEAGGLAQRCFKNPATSKCLAIGFNTKTPEAAFDYLAFVKRTELQLVGATCDSQSGE